MIISKDILLDEEGNFAVANGDLVVGNSDEQHIHLILASNKGEWLESPTMGAGLSKHLNGMISQSELIRDIKLDLQRDGYNVKSVNWNDGEITVDATRIR